ncbi:hypothetical protein Zmor_008805 [Zophobas morio]|uniref:Uncharacterized protein n=1 Tax=Zophobas morio TaxID=2755281 RepID=A0AA38HIP3_9CUCU|nr:hypothetical protein Zmor_008805 [Zophobas morio]
MGLVASTASNVVACDKPNATDNTNPDTNDDQPTATTILADINSKYVALDFSKIVDLKNNEQVNNDLTHEYHISFHMNGLDYYFMSAGFGTGHDKYDEGLTKEELNYV